MTPSKGFVVEWISSIIGLIFTAFGKFELKNCFIFRCYNWDLFDDLCKYFYIKCFRIYVVYHSLQSWMYYRYSPKNNTSQTFLENKKQILTMLLFLLGCGLMQGLVDTGSPKKALSYVNFKVLSGNYQKKKHGHFLLNPLFKISLPYSDQWEFSH